MTALASSSRVARPCRTIAVLCGSLAAACSTAPGDARGIAQAWSPQHAVAGAQLALIEGSAAGAEAQPDDAAPSLWLFDVGAARAGTIPRTRVRLPASPTGVWSRAGDGGELLILASGVRGQGAPPMLIVARPDGSTREVVLAAPYSAVAQTEDGRFAVAHFPAGAEQSSASVSQMDVIDLRGTGEARQLGLELDGRPPLGLWLTPALQVNRGELHFALAAFERALLVIELEHPWREPVRIELTGDSSRPARVTHVVTLQRQMQVAVLAEGLDDLFLIDVDSVMNERRYELAVAQYAVGTQPRDLALVDIALRAFFLVLSGSGDELRAVDPASGASLVLELDRSQARIATCPDGCSYALLYTTGDARVTLVDLTAETTADALHAIDLPTPVERVEVVPDQQRAYSVHVDGSLTLFDLVAGTAVPLGARVDAARSLQFARDGGMWLAAPDQEIVTRFDPATLVLSEVTLQAKISGFALVPEAGRAVAIHTGFGLALTVLNDDAPSSSHALYLEGLP
jgi:hypothetical protein